MVFLKLFKGAKVARHLKRAISCKLLTLQIISLFGFRCLPCLALKRLLPSFEMRPIDLVTSPLLEHAVSVGLKAETLLKT